MADYVFLVSLLMYSIASTIFTILQIPVPDFTEYQKYGLLGIILAQNIIIFMLVYFLYKIKKSDPDVRLMEKIMDLVGKKHDK